MYLYYSRIYLFYNVCLRLSFLSKNWFAASAKLILSRILMWILMWACIRLFSHVVSHSWPEVCFYALQSRKDVVTLWKEKKHLTILSTLLIKKLLFRHISGNFLIIVLSSNKLGNNFTCDTNLLMIMSSLLISNKKSPILQLVGY